MANKPKRFSIGTRRRSKSTVSYRFVAGEIIYAEALTGRRVWPILVNGRSSGMEVETRDQAWAIVKNLRETQVAIDAEAIEAEISAQAALS